MPGSTNFLQWNPTLANQETDAEYLADDQRVGGAPVGVEFPSPTGNKLFFQTSTMAAAIAQLVAGITGAAILDSNLPDLVLLIQAGLLNVPFCGTSGGTANAQTLTPSVIPASYVAGNAFRFFAGFNNTGSCSMNIGGLGTKTILKKTSNGVAPLTGSEIQMGQEYLIVYDGTNFQLDSTSFPLVSPNWCGTSTGSANTQALTPVSVVPSYQVGEVFGFIAGFTNTGAMTINVSGLGVKNLFKKSSAGPVAMAGGEIVAGIIYYATYDGTQFQVDAVAPAAFVDFLSAPQTNVSIPTFTLLTAPQKSFYIFQVIVHVTAEADTGSPPSLIVSVAAQPSGSQVISAPGDYVFNMSFTLSPSSTTASGMCLIPAAGLLTAGVALTLPAGASITYTLEVNLQRVGG